MKLRYILIILFSFILGIIITLLTGFISNTTTNLLGANKWGFPFYWMSQPVYPGADRIIIWSNLLIDILIWSFLLFMIICLGYYLLTKLKRKKK
ncbi:MAG: hypothetical protein ACFFCE_08020 [Promethearchaeota archaeon]